MNESAPVLAGTSHERAVYVEACDAGWDPRSLVRELVWHEGTLHVETLVFPSLRDALDYAQRAFGSSNGPAPTLR